MGVELLVGAAVFVATAVLSYVLYKPNIQQPSIKASGLDDFNITKATEGTPFTVVFGRVKIAGNILWYGNLKTVAQKSKSSGGKGGGGSKSTTTGYHYYLDCWQSICVGPVRILGMYKENKQFITSEINPQWSGVMADSGSDGVASTFTINKGDGVSNFTLNLEYFSPLKRICTMNMRRVFCGSGTSFPSFHFVVQSNYTTPYPDLPNGANPAGAVWYILTSAGTSAIDIDNASFTAASAYWTSKGYGINVAIGSQGKVREKIESILAPLGAIYFESGGKHYISGCDPFAAASDQIVDDFVKFTIKRKTWEDTINDLKATFTQESKDFSERTAVVQNSASVNMLGIVYTKTYDLTLFRDLETTQKRMAELIKSESYPYAEIDFTTNLRYSNIIEGSIVEITNTQYGIFTSSFRIVKKDVDNIDTNEISFSGVQVAESLFDDKWVSIGTGSSTWVREIQAPVPLTKTRIMEVPRNPYTDNPAIMVLAARQNGYETEFYLYYSPDNSNYEMLGIFNAYNMYATLKYAYGTNTYDIDDEVGLTVTYFKEDYEVESLTRTGLFSTNRFLIIDSEMMMFQTVTLNEDGTATFTGVIRGVMNTAKAAHSANAAVWIVDDIECMYVPSNGVIAGYYKIAPRNNVGSVNLSSISSIYVGPHTLAQKPLPISRVSGTRDGADIDFLVSVRDMSLLGAGVSASTLFSPNSDSDVLIEWKLSTDTDWTVLPAQTANFSVSNAATVTVNVRAKEFGLYTSTVTLVVGTADGTYII